MWWLTFSVMVVGYAVGSFPSGYLAGKLSGVDIRQHGSGNIGATNVLRVIGKPWGIAVFLADALKGFLAVWASSVLVARNGATDYSDLYAILAGAACVIGHSFPIWLGFRGGKGVATSAGVIFGILPIAALTIFLVWLVVFLVTRYVSVASIIAALALPLTVGLLVQLKKTQSPVLLYFSAAMTVLVIWRHRSNIARLLNGTEQRFTKE